MSPGDPKLNPSQRTAHIDELNRLDAEIRRATEVYTLKPIYDRLEELGRLYVGDSGIQSTIATVRATMVEHGKKLMEGQQGSSASNPLNQGLPLSSLPTQVMPSSPHAVATAPPTGGGYGLPPKDAPTPPGPPTGNAPNPGVAPFNWKRAAAVGAVIGVLVAAGFFYSIRRKPAEPSVADNQISVPVKTTPPGASVRINGEVKCTSECTLQLAPGSYEIQTVLPGYEPATSKIEVATGTPASVDVTLQPLPLSVRLYTDFPSGKVTFDGSPYGDLQDGQLFLDRIATGKHSIKVTAPSSEAQFEFETQPGRPPVVSGPVVAKNTLAILVSNAGQQAKVHSSVPSLKISVDGAPAGDAGASGLEIANLQSGDREFTVQDGTNERKLIVSVSPQPTLTAHLKLDINAGSIIIATPGVDDASLFINERPLKTKTKNGQAMLLGISVGSYTIRVAKDGFSVDPPQRVTVAKGQQSRLEFKLKEIPQHAGLRLRGAVTGTTVYLDGNPLGAVPASGSFEFLQIAPGEHVVELRRDKFAPKRSARQFRAGETIEFSGADVTLSAAAGTLRLTISPPGTQVTIKGPGDAAPHPVTGNSLQLADGTYVLTAKAANYTDRTQTVTMASGETKTLDLTLTETKSAKSATPARRTGTMADWDEAGAWVSDGGWYRRKGGNVVTYGITPTQGTFSFNISRIDGRKLQWAIDTRDGRNYVHFQLERKNFIRREIINGRDRNEFKFEHKLPDEKNYSVSIEITPTTVRTFILDGSNWREIDSWSTSSRNLAEGKFALVIPGGDTFGLSNFRFVPK